VHLPGHADARDVGRGHAGSSQHRPDVLDRTIPEEAGILFAPQRPRRLEGILRRSYCHDPTVRIDEQRLGGRRRYIEA
jgi:hypothetical protein